MDFTLINSKANSKVQYSKVAVDMLNSETDSLELQVERLLIKHAHFRFRNYGELYLYSCDCLFRMYGECYLYFVFILTHGEAYLSGKDGEHHSK